MPDIQLQPQSPEPALVSAVRIYWESKRGARAQPRRQDIVPAEIKPWLPYVLLAETIGGGSDFRYRLVGGELHRYFPSVPTGKLMSEVLAPFGEETVKKTIETYQSVLALGAPLRIKGDGAWYGQPPKYFEAILTPLACDDGTPGMVFGAFDFQWNFPAANVPAPHIDDQTWDAALSALR